uniref:C2H2-type domain-containing protein n=1 Tax=Panagrellus redivivus TaxID=6233 RepID=A0A7E4VTB9_PANRE
MIVAIIVAGVLAVIVVIIGIIGIVVATNTNAAYEFIMRRFRCCQRVCCYCCCKKGRLSANHMNGAGHKDETEITFKKVRSIKPLEDPADPEQPPIEPQQVEEIPATLPLAPTMEPSLRSELTRVSNAGVVMPERTSELEKSTSLAQASEKVVESIKDETTVTNPRTQPTSSVIAPEKPQPSEPPTNPANSAYLAIGAKDLSPKNKRRSHS